MHFDYQPTLRGELVALRPLHDGDYDALYEVASDPGIWEQHPANRNERAVFQEFFREAVESGGTLLAMEAETGRVIGSSRFHGYDPERKEVEIGWTFLARSHWGGLYNGEMKRLMCEHAFRLAESVVLLIAPENVRSQRAAEKVGAVRDGTRPDAYGRICHVYRVTAADLVRVRINVIWQASLPLLPPICPPPPSPSSRAVTAGSHARTSTPSSGWCSAAVRRMG